MVPAGGFFDGWNADKVLGFGLEAFNSHNQGKQAEADKAVSDAKTAAYQATQQRTQPASMFNGISRNMMIGGGAAAALVLILLLKGK